MPTSRRAAKASSERAETTELITIGRHRVRVSRRDANLPGTPLLLCNGVGAEYTLWDRFRSALNRPTIAFDVRSGHLGTRPSIRTYAHFVRQVLKQLDVDEVDVLGMSWGGMLAQQLAHDHPEVVRRIVLASTTPGFLSVPAKPSSSLALMSPSRHSERMNEVITKIYGGDFLNDPSLVRKLRLVRPIHEATYRRQLWATVGWTSVPWLPTVRQETLILHADDDPVIPVVNSRWMSWLMPRSRRVVVPGGGHLFLFTRSAEYADVVSSFLDDETTKQQRRPSRGSPSDETDVS